MVLPSPSFQLHMSSSPLYNHYLSPSPYPIALKHPPYSTLQPPITSPLPPTNVHISSNMCIQRYQIRHCIRCRQGYGEPTPYGFFRYRYSRYRDSWRTGCCPPYYRPRQEYVRVQHGMCGRRTCEEALVRELYEEYHRRNTEWARRRRYGFY